jgi:hypothetical protein
MKSQFVWLPTLSLMAILSSPLRAQNIPPPSVSITYGSVDEGASDYFDDGDFFDMSLSIPGIAIGNGSIFGNGNRLSVFSSMASRVGNYTGSVYVYGVFAGKIILVNVPVYAPVFTSDGVMSTCVAVNDLTFGGVRAQITWTWNQCLNGSTPNSIAWNIRGYAPTDLPKFPTGAVLSASGPLTFTGGQIVVTQPH